jgi:RNA polymerase sigma factor (sigma-70 family)
MPISQHASDASDQSDEALVHACRRGDQQAWEQLVRRYQRLIYTIARRAGLDEDQVGEVFQQVFVALFEQIEQIQQPDRLSAWLTTLTRRKTLQLLRGQTTIATLGNDDETAIAEILADPSPLPDELLIRLERQHTVRRAIAALEERCRVLITLLFSEAEAISYSHIAATLGISEGSIGPTRIRCLQKLRRWLEDQGF